VCSSDLGNYGHIYQKLDVTRESLGEVLARVA